MTTDDLRTRAREAAEERYPQEPDRGLAYPREVIRQGQAAAFIEGALWHAAQQPTREQIARAIYDADPVVAYLSEGQVLYSWEEAPPSVRSACLRAADAVLALFDGAGS